MHVQLLRPLNLQKEKRRIKKLWNSMQHILHLCKKVKITVYHPAGSRLQYHARCATPGSLGDQTKNRQFQTINGMGRSVYGYPVHRYYRRHHYLLRLRSERKTLQKSVIINNGLNLTQRKSRPQHLPLVLRQPKKELG